MLNLVSCVVHNTSLCTIPMKSFDQPRRVWKDFRKITTMLLNQSYVRVVILLLENTWMTVSFHCKGKFGPIKLVKFCHFYNERFCIFVLGVSILPLFLWFRYLYCSDWIFVLFWLDICTVLIGYLYCSDWISVLFWLDICTVLIGYLYCSDWIFVLFWCCGIYFCYHMYTLYFFHN